MEKQYVAENGMKIFYYPGKHLHSFCLSLYLKAGSMYEEEERNGLSHFLEHIVIRNINYLMDDGLYPYLDRLGLLFNACTYKEFVQFEITGAGSHFKEAADVFLKLFEPICLPASEIQIERRRVKAEIREDDEKNSLSFFSNQIVWRGTSLARPITGMSRQLDHMGKKVLQTAHRQIFAPDNLFFYVTGCADEEDILYLKRRAGSRGLSDAKLTRDNMAPVPPDFFDRSAKVAIKKSSDTMVRFSFDMDTARYSQAVYMLLYDILFECESSKIHQALSERSGFIYSFDPGMEQYSNIGTLYFQYEVQPARLLESVKIVVALFRELKRGIRDELDYVKAAYTDNAEILLDHAENLNWTQSYEAHILKKSSGSLNARKREYEAVTAQDITELARELFRCGNLVVTIKGKKSLKLEKQVREILKELDQEE
ncbi:insulinase family protein [bacterium 210820-DFI.6.37]|nr:insulinase family protein [bacterium 210820-DFI.6.37]